MSQLPGIGKRTALRLVLHMLRQPKEQTLALTDALQNMRNTIKFCKSCHNISDVDLCEICSSSNSYHVTMTMIIIIRRKLMLHLDLLMIGMVQL